MANRSSDRRHPSQPVANRGAVPKWRSTGPAASPIEPASFHLEVLINGNLPVADRRNCFPRKQFGPASDGRPFDDRFDDLARAGVHEYQRVRLTIPGEGALSLY